MKTRSRFVAWHREYASTPNSCLDCSRASNSAARSTLCLRAKKGGICSAQYKGCAAKSAPVQSTDQQSHLALPAGAWACAHLGIAMTRCEDALSCSTSRAAPQTRRTKPTKFATAAPPATVGSSCTVMRYPLSNLDLRCCTLPRHLEVEGGDPGEAGKFGGQGKRHGTGNN